MILFDPLFLAIPDDAPVLESDNEEDMESDRRISSKCTLLILKSDKNPISAKSLCFVF